MVRFLRFDVLTCDFTKTDSSSLHRLEFNHIQRVPWQKSRSSRRRVQRYVSNWEFGWASSHSRNSGICHSSRNPQGPRPQ